MLRFHDNDNDDDDVENDNMMAMGMGTETSVSDVDLLLQYWVNERFAPDILPYQSSLVDALLELLEAQVFLYILKLHVHIYSALFHFYYVIMQLVPNVMLLMFVC